MRGPRGLRRRFLWTQPVVSCGQLRARGCACRTRPRRRWGPGRRSEQVQGSLQGPSVAPVVLTGESCRSRVAGSREVRAGSGHPVALTPRSWKVQKELHGRSGLGCARLWPVTSAAASEKHQPFPGLCTEAAASAPGFTVSSGNTPFPACPVHSLWNVPQAPPCRALQTHPTCVQARPAALREGGRGPTPASGGRGGTSVRGPFVHWACPCAAGPALSSPRPGAAAGPGPSCWSWAFGGDLGLLGARPFPKLAVPSWGQIPCVVCAVSFSLSPTCLLHFLVLHPHAPSLSSSLGWQALLWSWQPSCGHSALRLCPHEALHRPVPLRPAVGPWGQAASRRLCVPVGPAARGQDAGLTPRAFAPPA